MKIRTGIDIIEVERIHQSVANSGPHFTERIYTKSEIEYCSSAANKYERFAARFAAKEAFAKALGTGFTGLCLSDFYVAKDERGKPYFVFGDKTKKILDNSLANNYNIQLSLSHENEFAVAFVIIEKGDN